MIELAKKDEQSEKTSLVIVDRIDQLSRLWCEFLKERKPTTQRTYQQCLDHLTRYLGKDSETEALNYLTTLDAPSANALALEWKNALSERLAPSTVNVHLSTLKSACRFLRMMGFIAWSVEIRQKKVTPYRDTKGPSLDVLQQAIRFLKQEQTRKASGKIGHPWQAAQLETIFLLLFSLGLRRAELCAIQIDDLDQQASGIWIMGKGNSQKIRLTLPPNAQKALLAWIEYRRQLLPFAPNETACKSLFLNPNGTPLKPSNLYHQIRQLGSWIGATIKPHGIRHAAISQAFEQAKRNPKIGLAEIQRFSRHAKAETLLLYRDAQRDDALLVADSLDAFLCDEKS